MENEEATQPGTSPSFAFAVQPPSPSIPHTPSYSAQLPPFRLNEPYIDTFYTATQLVVDPRRLGQGNSGLNDEDLADICCMLVPASRIARQACALVYETTPQHTIPTENDVQIREKDKGNIFEVDDSFDDLDPVPCNIALRITADLKDIVGGFHFGRNPDRCDIVLGAHDVNKRVSNVHFRIYINEHGVIMLEDQSTNGTAVDGNLLRGKDKENNLVHKHTLVQGSVIVLTMNPPSDDYRFTVRIPTRDEDSERQYQRNLTDYFFRASHARQLNVQRVAAAEKGNGHPVNLFPAGLRTPNAGSGTSVGRVGKTLREWKGGKKYNKVEMIGKGAFAVVYMLTTKFDGQPYAAKELEKRRFMKNGVLDQKVDMEMKIMSKIKHPNVVQYIEHVDWEEYLYIIMEYVPHGDLGSLIREQALLPEPDVKTMAIQLLSALKYLHDGGITHRDVKPDNILIASHDPFQVKLTDFGLSKMIDSEETFLRTFCGTLLYCAPEVYSEYREYDNTGRRQRGIDKRALPPQRYGHAVDVWSLAGVLFYALSGSPPYPVKNGTSYQELLNQIMTVVLSIKPLQEAGVSDAGIRFVRGMLHTDPQYRSTIEDLQRSSWIVGGQSFEVSMDDDDEEVDMVDDGYIDPALQETQLEEGASQLSIHDNGQLEIRDSDELIDNESVETVLQGPEIPSSFNTSDGLSNGDESYQFAPTLHNPANGRLFGEVNVSNIGSSGAIPLSHLNLPQPTHTFYSQSDISDESQYGRSEYLTPMEGTTRTQSAPQTTMPPPPPRPTSTNAEVDDHRAARSSSLMGAESMVGHLNVNSPAAAASPHPESPAATTEEYRDATVSLRRPREEDPEDDLSWIPENLPKRQRTSSTRLIDLPVPAKIFWDPKDKSTQHYNYPHMMMSEYEGFKELAKSKGESFNHGHKTFDHTMQSFRGSTSSRGSSIEPPELRAQSEPTKEEGRRILMKRDERQLADDTNKENGPPADAYLPNTAHTSKAPSPADTASANATFLNAQPVVGNDFQPPKRILAKLVSTPNSCLPTITFNVTESVTTWGRGSQATLKYSNGLETRIPKYAFKILFFKPGFYSTSKDAGLNTRAWDDDMRFYISTKAGSGIFVNSEHLKAVHAHIPGTPAEFWGELKHGDIIDVWRDAKNPSVSTQLRFECYWGLSKDMRNGGNPADNFKTVKDSTLLTEIEQVCLSQEQAILAEKSRLEAEEKRIAKKVKHEAKQAASQETLNPQAPSFNFRQSLAGAPSNT